MLIETSIRMVPPPSQLLGRCEICGRITKLSGIDVSTGQRFGSCCSDEMIYADTQIEMYWRDVRRPNREERLPL